MKAEHRAGIAASASEQSPQAESHYTARREGAGDVREELGAPQSHSGSPCRMAPFVRCDRIDEHQTRYVFRKTMGIDAHDVGAEGVTGENERARQIERVNQPMQIVRQPPQRPAAARWRAPAKAGAVVAARLRACRQLRLDAAPVQTRGGDAGLEDDRRPAAANLANMKPADQAPNRREPTAIAANADGLHGHAKHETGCDQCGSPHPLPVLSAFSLFLGGHHRLSGHIAVPLTQSERTSDGRLSTSLRNDRSRNRVTVADGKRQQLRRERRRLDCRGRRRP